MLALYLLTLGISGGILGIFFRQVLGENGCLQGFRTEILLAVGVVCIYCAIQLAYVALLRVFKPTKSGVVLFMESLSHAGAILLIPYLLHVRVSWPHPAMQKVEPLIFLGAFATVHLFFKLASLFAALRGEPCGRFGALGWLLTSGICAGAACFMLVDWMKELELVRPEPPGESRFYQVGDQYASAISLKEGAVVGFDVPLKVDATVTLRLANPPDLPADAPPLNKVYVSVTLEGREIERNTYPIVLNSSGWSELGIPISDIPSEVQSCRVVWDIQKPAKWKRLIGIRPISTSGRSLLLSGPFAHNASDRTHRSSFLIIALEGLAADHVTHLGYRRNTTPSLDKLAQTSATFSSAYTPAPDARAACTTLLTGISPLRHGALGTNHTLLPKDCVCLTELLSENGYATAAFTEGEAVDTPDLVFESGIERGFEVFDASYRAESVPVEGKKVPFSSTATTLAKVRSWVTDHADRDFMVFARLRELRDPKWQARYAPGFLSTPENPSAIDVYDSAVAYTDRAIGDLVKYVRASEGGKNTCIIITSTYGIDFSNPANPPVVGLTEDSLHVPLIVFTPKGTKITRAGFVSLVDVMPTVLGLAQIVFEGQMEGKNLMEEFGQRSAISMFGSPLALSLRTDRWRFSWQSGMTPFTWEAASQPGAIELYDVFQAKKRGIKNEVARQTDLVNRYTLQLQNYLNAYRGVK